MVISPINIPCVKLLPLDFSDCVTDYEMLCKLLRGINESITEINKLNEITTVNSNDIKQLQDAVNYINGELKKIANGEYMEVYINALARWIDNNLQIIVAKIAKQVFFGLKGDYFVAYIPESWSDITFDTGNICGSPEWGHLILKY